MEWIDKIINKRNLAFYLFGAAFFVYIFNSWGVSIYILDEAKNASCAREMFESKNVLIPTFNYDLRTDKPPLHYFFMMLSYSIFGVNAFAARFFSAVFGALTVLITFLYTRRFTNSLTAFWAAFVLLSSIHLSLQFHLAVPDPYLIFFMVWSLFAFYASVHENKRAGWFWIYFSMGLATLTKGPVAIVLPGFIFFLYLIFSKNLRWPIIKTLKPFAGVVIVLAIALPWYLLNGLATDWEWTRGFFLDHNLNRFSSEMEGHGGIFLLTVLFVLIGLFPFTVLLPQAIRYAFGKRQNSFVLFNLIAAITIVGFFSVSQTKLPNYTVPSYPFIAVLIAFFVVNKLEAYREIKIAYLVLLGIGILLPIVAFVAMQFDPSLLPARRLSIWLLVLPICVALAWFYRIKLQKFLILIGVSGLITALVFFGIIYPKIDCRNPVSKSIDILGNSEIAFFEKFNPSYAFYLQRKIPRIGADEFDAFFMKHPDGYIISTESRLKEIEQETGFEVIFSGKDLFETPTTVVIAKKKN